MPNRVPAARLAEAFRYYLLLQVRGSSSLSLSFCSMHIEAIVLVSVFPARSYRLSSMYIMVYIKYSYRQLIILAYPPYLSFRKSEQAAQEYQHLQ